VVYLFFDKELIQFNLKAQSGLQPVWSN